MDFMTKIEIMKLVKDKMVNPRVRYTKVYFHNKNFRRFQYLSRGRTVDILWLSDDRNFIPEFLEQKLEKEFEKVG
jgi:hypothetical protein